MRFTKAELAEISLGNGGKFRCETIEDAFAFTKKITLGHYENFPAGSLLLPKNQRRHLFNIYTFARIADDIADEPESGSPLERIEMLAGMENLLINQIPGNPVSEALHFTINEKNIPAEPFNKLLDAFRMDVNFRQPENLDDLFFYCLHSANPVGELVLRVFDLYNDETAVLSDKICTALQLANFWQDLSLDIKKGRIYIPKDSLKTCLGENKFFLNDETSLKLLPCLENLYEITDNLFDQGRELIYFLRPLRLKMEIKLTIEGGRSILQKTRQLKENIFFQRPRLKKKDYLNILFRSCFF